METLMFTLSRGHNVQQKDQTQEQVIVVGVKKEAPYDMKHCRPQKLHPHRRPGKSDYRNRSPMAKPRIKTTEATQNTTKRHRSSLPRCFQVLRGRGISSGTSAYDGGFAIDSANVS
ncbi:hypothetical protein FH972_026133 [Carpinus fangiana]|uniref:Uncharacterized protein n=1 Tax=Carpinus fangiana TaxID=176857 RepID=A0A5N6L3E9_9ROSI|nr:hypothetical protein FH972_026133 [Carpinus fangiana]